MQRQRTLEATVARSYDLLDLRERALFDRASVFAGGFTLAAAEQVCTGEPLPPEDTLDVLSALAEQSLVQHETSEEGSRFSLLETMRADGQQQLAAAGEGGRRRGAHLAWANDFARTAEPHLNGPEQGHWLDLVAADIDNIRAALSWAATDGDPVLGLGCAATLYRYWYVRAIREGRLWLERLLAEAGQAPPKLVAKALYAVGELTQMTGDYPVARERHQAALGIYRAIGNRRGEAWTLMGLGRAEWGAIEPAALKRRFVAAVEIFRELGDVAGLAFTLPYVAGCEFIPAVRTPGVRRRRGCRPGRAGPGGVRGAVPVGCGPRPGCGRAAGRRDVGGRMSGDGMAWRDRVVAPQDAVSVIRPGDHVFVGTACATPDHAAADAGGVGVPPKGALLVHVLLSGDVPELYASGLSGYRHRCSSSGAPNVNWYAAAAPSTCRCPWPRCPR